MTGEPNSIANKVMQEIEEKKLEPFSKGYFLRKKALLWTLVVIAIFVGGHSLGVLLYFFFDFDFSLLPFFLKSPGQLAAISGIGTWFIFLFVAIWRSWAQYRKTSTGYRTENLKLFLFIVIGISIIGGISYDRKISGVLEQVFEDRVSFYQSWHTTKVNFWSQPENGLLSGTIISVSGTANVEIIDSKGKNWIIDSGSAKIRRRVDWKPGTEIKLIGILESGKFVAHEIRPWHGKNRHRGLNRNLD